MYVWGLYLWQRLRGEAASPLRSTGAKFQRILQDSCGDGIKETVTYWKAAKSPIKVNSNKTL